MPKAPKRKIKRSLPAGVKKVSPKAKMVWLSKQSKHGYSLGLAFSNRTVWVTGLRFASPTELKKVLKKDIVFVNLVGKE